MQWIDTSPLQNKNNRFITKGAKWQGKTKSYVTVLYFYNISSMYLLSSFFNVLSPEINGKKAPLEIIKNVWDFLESGMKRKW